MHNLRLRLFRQTKNLVSIFLLGSSARCLRSAGLALLLAFSFTAIASHAARADDQDQQITEVVQWFADTAAGATGLPINSQEVDVTTKIVKCAVNGGDAGGCAEKAAVSELLSAAGLKGATGAAVDAAVGCLVDHTSASSCIQKIVTDNPALPIPSEAKPMVGCVMDGGNLADCTKKFAEGQILSQIPEEVRPIAECMIESPTPGCVAKAAVNNLASNLPQQAKDVVTCIGNASSPGDAAKCGAAAVPLPKDTPAAVVSAVKDLEGCASAAGANIQQCAVKFATGQVLAQIPDGPGKDAATQAANCIESKNVQQCGNGVVNKDITDAEQQKLTTALGLIGKLNPDDPIPHDLSNGIKSGASEKASLQNIVKVVEAVQQGNIGDVIIYGGPEIAKVASKIILDHFVGPLSTLLAPVVDAMIQNDVDAAKMGLSALYHGDAIGVAETAFKWYETSMVQGGCALLPNGGFHDTVCGGIADAINWAADTAGGLAKDILKVGKDILEKLGLWDPIDDVATAIWSGLQSVIDDIGHFFGIGDDDKQKIIKVCVTQPADYFATQVLGGCFASATAGAGAGNLNTSGVTAACVGYYSQCVDQSDAAKAAAQTKAVGQNCQKMADALGTAAGKAAAAMNAAAQAYTDTTGAALFAANISADNLKDNNLPPNKERDLCSPSFWSDAERDYAFACAHALTTPNKNGAPPYFSANLAVRSNACPIPTPSMPAAQQACLNAIRASASKGLFAGPGTPYCTKQEDQVAVTQMLHPCYASKPRPPRVFGVVEVVFRLPGFKNCEPLPGGEITPMHTDPPRVKPFPGAGGRDPIGIILPGVKAPPFVIPASLPLSERERPRGAPKASQTGSGKDPRGWDVKGPPGPAPKAKPSKEDPFRPPGQAGVGGGGSPMDQAGQAATGGGLANVGGSAGGPAIGGSSSTGGGAAGYGSGSRPQAPPKQTGAGGITTPGKGGGTGGANGNSGGNPGPVATGGGVGQGGATGGGGRRTDPFGGGTADRRGNKPKPANIPTTDYGACCAADKFVEPK
jgi:hypothetical protein